MGTNEYSAYIDELIHELQYVKDSFDYRKKAGKRYRKEASKIQDAFSELRRLYRKNEKILNAKIIRPPNTKKEKIPSKNRPLSGSNAKA